MGWLFIKDLYSRKDLIHHLITRTYSDPLEGTCLKHCIRGNILWSVWKIYNKETKETKCFIGCDLMQNGGGDGWGYKDMDESVGPLYYTCPLGYFNLVSIENYKEESQKIVKEFREKCKQYQEEKRSPKLWREISNAWKEIQKTNSNKSIILKFKPGWKAKGRNLDKARLIQIWPTRGYCSHGFQIQITRKAIESFEIIEE